jgi:hypothetical protein
MSRAILAVLIVAACRGQEQPGFDIVRVPQTAYLTPDAAPAPDAGAPDASGREGGTFRPSIPPLCFTPPPKTPTEDEAVEAFPECTQYHAQQYFDEDRTKRAREKAQKPLCCYQVLREEE